MKSVAKFDVVQNIGTYQDTQGNTKFITQTVGVVFENEKGFLSMKLTSYPLPDVQGEVWVKLFARKQKE